MSKATSGYSISDAAAEIRSLINARPHSPHQGEIERIIGRVHLGAALVASVAELDASKARAEYLGLIDEVRQFCRRTEGASVEEEKVTVPILSALQDAVVVHEEEKIWSKPAKTWADVLLYGEAALFNENGIMVNLGCSDAYQDERAIAELIDAVVTVGRRFFGHEDDGRREGDV